MKKFELAPKLGCLVSSLNDSPLQVFNSTIVWKNGFRSRPHEKYGDFQTFDEFRSYVLNKGGTLDSIPCFIYVEFINGDYIVSQFPDFRKSRRKDMEYYGLPYPENKVNMCSRSVL